MYSQTISPSAVISMSAHELRSVKSAGSVVLAGGDAGRPGRTLTVYRAGRAKRD